MKTIKYIESSEIHTFEDLSSALNKGIGIKIGNTIMVDYYPVDYDIHEIRRIDKILINFVNKCAQ